MLDILNKSIFNLNLFLRGMEVLFLFRHFENEKPKVKYDSITEEVSLDWMGYEIPIHDALELLRQRGYIEPTDFMDNYLKPH
jgi:hypothetical protein